MFLFYAGFGFYFLVFIMAMSTKGVQLAIQLSNNYGEAPEVHRESLALRSAFSFHVKPKKQKSLESVCLKFHVGCKLGKNG